MVWTGFRFPVTPRRLAIDRTGGAAGPFPASIPSGIASARKRRCNAPAMNTKSRQVIYGGRIIGAKIRAERAREAARQAVRDADRAEAEAWSIQMEGYGGPAQPSPTIAQCLNGGLRWLQVKCHRCETEASIPLDCVRRPRDTPIWKLEASLKCRSCRKGRYAPPVHMIKPTATREITPYGASAKALPVCDYPMARSTMLSYIGMRLRGSGARNSR